jgi:Rnl2 family RNA ligase
MFHPRALKVKEWVVMEKVHGANLSISMTSPTDITCSKRRAVIPDDDSFFGFRAVVDRMRPALAIFYESLHALAPDLHRVYLYGELFGGAGDCAVQPGVCYCRSLEFMLFDVKVEYNSGFSGWLDWDCACQLAQQAGLYYAKPLHVGTLASCMAFEYHFESKVARDFAPGSHLQDAEGVVIKPLRGWMQHSSTAEFDRPIVKRKVEKFAEGAVVNAARIESAVSKIGKLSAKTRAAVEKEIVADMLGDDRLAGQIKHQQLPSLVHDAVENYMKTRKLLS